MKSNGSLWGPVRLRKSGINKDLGCERLRKDLQRVKRVAGKNIVLENVLVKDGKQGISVGFCKVL